MSRSFPRVHTGSSLVLRLRWPRRKDAPAGNEQLLPMKAPAPDGVRQELEALEKRLGRMDREQFKSRALAEAQMEQFAAALEMLRAADTRREADLDAWREQSQAAQAAARLEVVQAMLPALDGLDEALRSGRHLLEQHPAPRPPTLLERLSGGPPRRPADAGLYQAMAAWLDGLTFVRQRLLDVLAAEGVQPMAAEGQTFDPHYHVALEVDPPRQNCPPGTVSAELRRGYLVGNKVLRYAEVAVAAEASA